MRRLLRPFWFLLALLFLLEAWIWDTLAPAIAWLVRHVPFEAFKAAVARAFIRLPPPVVLLVFAIPGFVLLPFKIAGLWLIAKGHPILGVGAFFAAKTAGVGVSAFLFEVCRERLLLMGWFRSVYAWVIRARDWAHRQVDPVIRRIRAFRRAVVMKIRAALPSGGRVGKLRAQVHARARRGD
jgi:hypothetical protein